MILGRVLVIIAVSMMFIKAVGISLIIVIPLPVINLERRRGSPREMVVGIARVSIHPK